MIGNLKSNILGHSIDIDSITYIRTLIHYHIVFSYEQPFLTKRFGANFFSICWFHFHYSNHGLKELWVSLNKVPPQRICSNYDGKYDI